jgi:hypothetical protein
VKHQEEAVLDHTTTHVTIQEALGRLDEARDERNRSEGDTGPDATTMPAGREGKAAAEKVVTEGTIVQPALHSGEERAVNGGGGGCNGGGVKVTQPEVQIRGDAVENA